MKKLSFFFVILLASLFFVACSSSDGDTDDNGNNGGNGGNDGSKPCLNQTCSGYGTCKLVSDKATCECDEGYVDDGLSCIEVKSCDDMYCGAWGTCDGGICKCQPGFEGENCEIDIDECDPNPCKNNAECVQGHNKYFCKCPVEFGGEDCDVPSRAFITTWQTVDKKITIERYRGNTDRIYGEYNYNIDCNNDGVYEAEAQTGDYTCVYEEDGVYAIAILGLFSKVMESKDMLSVEQWGTQAWDSMEEAFQYANKFVFNATDLPDLSRVTSMKKMFNEARKFNQDISAWDVSNVKNMHDTFQGAVIFNKPLDSWDVSNVTDMQGMFGDASEFNQDLNSWDVSNVTNMEAMFFDAKKFNADISSWKPLKVENMLSMFSSADAFDSDITSWDVSSVKSMRHMFSETPFNRDISSWNVSNVTSMYSMFSEAELFNQDLSSWTVEQVTECHEFSYLANSWILAKPNFTNCSE